MSKAAAQASLIRVDTEPAGSNCAAGGVVVRNGLDADGNGQLSDAEAQPPHYVCNGVPAAQATRPEVDDTEELAGETVDSTARVDELIKAANAAIKDTHYSKGFELCRQAIEQDPENQQALMTCAIAACNLEDAAAAKGYMGKITSETRKAGLMQICIRQGLKMD